VGGFTSGAVYHEGKILDALVQRRRNQRAALKLIYSLLRKQGFAPRLVVSDKLRSYGAPSKTFIWPAGTNRVAEE
jgi:transposase-like protein